MPYEGRHTSQVKPPDRPTPFRPGSGKSWKLKIFLGLAALCLLGGVGLGVYLWNVWNDLPAVEALRDYRPSLATKVYGDDGKVVGQFYIERRTQVPFSRIPTPLIHAVIAVEDSRFYEHSGIDPRGIARAFWTNIEHLSLKEGASTITQQLARSLFLTAEKSFLRKLREAMLALKIERLLSKNEILELYLNQIYLGHGSYGVQAASQTYFGKDVDKLSMIEAAFIAGLPRAPTDYSPYRNPDRAKQRQGTVLKRMLDEHYISEEEFRVAYQQDLFFKRMTADEQVAPYLLEYVRRHLSSKYGEDMVYKGGLSVYTSLNVQLQEAANKAVSQGLQDLDKRQGFRGPIAKKEKEEIERLTEEGGVLATMPKPGDILEAVVIKVDDHPQTGGATVVAGSLTGRIKVSEMAWAARRLVGQDLSRDVQATDKPTPSLILSEGDVVLVRVVSLGPKKQEAAFALEQEPIVEAALVAVDPRTGAIKAMVGGFDFKRSEFNRAIQARRQPGSAFKPIIYAAALLKGLTPATILIDAPIVYEDTETGKIWKPENYEGRFYGPVSLREALVNSRNLATVRLLDQVGIAPAIQTARQLGVTSPLTRDLSLALGSSGVGLLELTSAYGTFANAGIHVKPRVILSIEDSQRQPLEVFEPESVQAISPEVAYVVTSLLQDVIQRGTGRRAKVLGAPVAGKTGTTNDFSDAWFIGYAPNLVVGVWVGFDDLRPLGDREAGATAALPIWIDFMRRALELLPHTTFSLPDGVVFAQVDPETGMLAREGSSNGATELFVPGSEPKETAPAYTRPTDFYHLDAVP